MNKLNRQMTSYTDRPVTVIQFGEGNFLRAFVDYMIDIANEKGLFNGNIVLIKPIEFGTLDRYKAQDCQYTVQLRGRVNGNEYVETRQITSVKDIVSPFDNYEEVSRFIKLIHDSRGYDMGLRNITVSTCGIIPKIKRFAKDFPQVNLAISLHAPNQEIREKSMPVAKKYGYDDLIDACREYTETTGRRITFEYAVIDGVNDSAECAEELAGRLKGWLAHVNLIPLNEVEGREYRTAKGANVKRFRDILERNGVAVTVRRTLGSDIDAACGQLRRRR